MNRKKKILILSNVTYDLYSMRREVVEALLKEDYEVYISAIIGRNAEDFEKMGCIMIDSPIERRGINPIKDFLLILHYVKIIVEIKPDVVLTYTIKPNLYGGIACSVKRIPYISNITGLGSVENSLLPIKLIVKTLYRIGLKKSNCIFYQNVDGLHKINRLLKRKDRYQLIPGSGVNIDYFNLLSYPDEHEIHFLFISRVMKEKGIDQYLEAAEIIREKYRNVYFHILGFCEENYEGKLNEFTNKGIVIYHGLQKDVRKFHEISHCTIHPTYYAEGISNVLLESAASGRPIITTDHTGTRETVVDGETGFLFEKKNTNDLVLKIEIFLKIPNEKRREMGIKGRQKILLEFDRQKVIKAYINELRKTENCEEV